MRIGILTASRTDNNGTDLQALAMLNMFRRLGAKDVEIIDYVCDNLESGKYLLKPLSLKKLYYFPIKAFLHIKHNRFRKRQISKSQMKYSDCTLSSAHYDTIVVGSDQIWNLEITGYDLSFYLPFFGINIKKYSYAASIGKTDVREWENRFQLAEKLKHFECVSVREESAVEALKQIGVTARYDLDPILMGQYEDWNKFIHHTNKRKYILLYLLDNKSPAWDYAKKLAETKGWSVINCSPTPRHYGGVKTLRFVGVEKWIDLVANAQMIFTSSYHCISFAILFNRQFCLVPLQHSQQSNARMLNLVHRIGLDSCVFSSKYEPILINWKDVNNNLETIKSRSEQYVKSIINN